MKKYFFLPIAFSLLIFPNLGEARFKKSGFIRVGAGIARQHFEHSDKTELIFINPEDPDSPGNHEKLTFLNGYQFSAEYFLTNIISFGLKYQKFESGDTNIRSIKTLDREAVYQTAEIKFAFEITKGIDFFRPGILEFGVGYGYGFADLSFKQIAKNPAVDKIDEDFKGTIQQPLIYVDYGGYGWGLRLTANYNLYDLDPVKINGQKIDYKDDLDYVSFALEIRYSFYNRDPIFQGF